MSPKVITAAIEAIFKPLEERDLKHRWRKTNRPRFADDITLVTSTVIKDIEIQLDNLNDEIKKWALPIRLVKQYLYGLWELLSQAGFLSADLSGSRYFYTCATLNMLNKDDTLSDDMCMHQQGFRLYVCELPICLLVYIIYIGSLMFNLLRLSKQTQMILLDMLWYESINGTNIIVREHSIQNIRGIMFRVHVTNYYNNGVFILLTQNGMQEK